MCIFIVLHKDGTPFEVASIMEEDIVQFCMRLGHIHPLGVLQYSATELVVLFHTAEEMQWASCGAIKATELCDELIAVKIVAPTEPHIRAYITVGEGYPLNCHLHPQRKRMTQIHHLVTPTRVGYTATPPGRARRLHRPGTVATQGGSLSGDCPLQMACTPSSP